MGRWKIFFFLLWGSVWSWSSLGWGAEWQPGTHGDIVVEAAISTIQRLFSETGLADISGFLRRIARAESSCGEDLGTYRAHYFGGIWQLDQVAYEETKRIEAHPRLAKWHCAIERNARESGLSPLDWRTTQWEQLTAPAYSCMAARLYLACIPEPVPTSLVAQAAYWKKYYNTEAGSGTERGFVRANSLKGSRLLVRSEEGCERRGTIEKPASRGANGRCAKLG